MDRYRIVELVGEGSFGRVFRGVRKSDGLDVALKLIPKLGHSDKDLKGLRSECKIQMSLSHPNIVEMVDAFETPKEVVAVTEFMPNGDLHKIIKNGVVAEDKVKKIASCLVEALHYLHSKRVLHRDLKPANVLLNSDFEPKICDFGFARSLGLETMVLTSIKGTPLYMAPELIEEKPYDHTADLWSVGAIIYELAVGHPPFPTNSLFQLIKKIRYEGINWPQQLSRDLKSFLSGLLEKDPKKRFSWQQVLQHPFVNLSHLTYPSKDFQPLTELLSESQELAKEIQRQEKAKLLPGGSQTLIKVAQRYEEQKKRIEAKFAAEAEAVKQMLLGPTVAKGQRRNSEATAFVPKFNSSARRPSNLAEYYSNSVFQQKASRLPRQESTNWDSKLEEITNENNVDVQHLFKAASTEGNPDQLRKMCQCLVLCFGLKELPAISDELASKTSENLISLAFDSLGSTDANVIDDVIQVSLFLNHSKAQIPTPHIPKLLKVAEFCIRQGMERGLASILSILTSVCSKSSKNDQKSVLQFVKNQNYENFLGNYVNARVKHLLSHFNEN